MWWWKPIVRSIRRWHSEESLNSVNWVFKLYQYWLVTQLTARDGCLRAKEDWKEMLEIQWDRNLILHVGTTMMNRQPPRNQLTLSHTILFYHGAGRNAAAAQADWHAEYAAAQPTEQTPADIHIAIPAAAAHPAWHVAYVAGPHSTIPIKEALVMTARARVTLLLNMVMGGRIIEFFQLEVVF